MSAAGAGVRSERASLRDVPRVGELARASLAEAWSDEGFAAELAQPHTVALVARETLPGDGAESGLAREAAERVVGYLVAHRVGDELHVLSLAVAATARRRGVASALLRAVLPGIRSAQLEVRPTSAAARALYARFGFREVGRRSRYYADGEDALLMTLEAPVVRTPLRTSGRVTAWRGDGSGRCVTLAIPDWPGSAPGQFVMLSPGPRDAAPRFDPLLPRPMAVYRSRPLAGGGAEVDILFKVSGRGTKLLAAARAGDEVGVVGPLGRGFAPPQRGDDALLVGGGTGIASLLDLAAAASAAGRVHVLLGARRAKDLLGVDDFEGLGVRVSVATEDGSRGRPGLVTGLLQDALAEWPEATVYACGPTPMMRRCAEIAAAGGRRCVVSLENPMACGFGVCLGCAAPRSGGGFSLVCRDGPVFDASEIDWEKLS